MTRFFVNCFLIGICTFISCKILGFVDDIHDDEAARRILYPSEIDEQVALANYIHEISALLCGI